MKKLRAQKVKSKMDSKSWLKFFTCRIKVEKCSVVSPSRIDTTFGRYWLLPELDLFSVTIWTKCCILDYCSRTNLITVSKR
jgi:hypothetical protein